jgi:hypothetical protein
VAKTMSIYCKAYQLKQLQSFPRWPDNTAVLPADKDNAMQRDLDGDDVVYIHDNLVVTDGIYKDENILFESSDSDWSDFCMNELAFEIPEDVVRANSMTEEAEEV